MVPKGEKEQKSMACYYHSASVCLSKVRCINKNPTAIGSAVFPKYLLFVLTQQDKHDQYLQITGSQQTPHVSGLPLAEQISQSSRCRREKPRSRPLVSSSNSLIPVSSRNIKGRLPPPWNGDDWLQVNLLVLLLKLKIQEMLKAVYMTFFHPQP